MGLRRVAGLLVVAVGLQLGAAQAQTGEIRIPEEPLGQALKDLASQTGTNVLFAPDVVAGLQAHALSGTMSAREAVERLLLGTSLEVVPDSSGGLVVRRKASGLQHADNVGPGPETVVVTGSRIPGAEVASPIIRVTQDQIKAQGYTDLGQVVRSLPQSFNGGQNPGVVPGSPNLKDQNITSASSINLRGLGADATLTLLNGRRLAYDGFTQAIDIATIPVDAVDRLEVLLDGASAIYGSDAVGGVANVVLKRDYDGLAITGRYGASSDGGGEQAAFNAVGGKTWDTGGFMLAYAGEWDSKIDAPDRHYTAFLGPNNSLLPSILHQNVLLSGHQELMPGLEFDLDATYSFRNANSASDTFGFLGLINARSETWVVSPTLHADLPAGWAADLNGSVGVDHVRQTQSYTYMGTVFPPFVECYCNTAQSVELDAQGPLFALPGGDAHASIGGGYRNNGFRAGINVGSRHAFYAFGEVNLPFLSPEQSVPFAYRLSANAALRYEHYSDFGSVVTPKVGMIWGPTADFDFKGTWGQSFKAPTLQQEYSPLSIDLAPVPLFGGSGPMTDIGFLLQGGQPGIKPERANTYTLGFDAHPRWVDGLDVQFDYFYVGYNNRVVSPIANPSAALSDPSFAEFVIHNPSVALLENYLATAGSVNNQTGMVPFDPTTVTDLIDNRYTNAVRQRVSGIDLTFSYLTELADGSLTTTGNFAWLNGNQQNTPISPVLETVGTIYNPPKFRFRGGFDWTRDGLTLGLYDNYIGGVLNNQIVPNEGGGGMMTIDVVADYKVDAIGPVDNLEFNLAILNVADEKPPLFNNSVNPFVVNYDSTNYSVVGRYVGFSITKRW
jgi:outer membrane receptor protein involved in Fe transport